MGVGVGVDGWVEVGEVKGVRGELCQLGFVGLM